jgi:polysaccharide export outer membrane protein
VSSTGQITLPLIGSVAVAGKTATEIESDVAARLGKTYLRSPQVSVSVTEARSQRITVGGAVKTPGVFPISGTTTLLQSIALAQGLDTIADPTNVVVFRYSNGQRMAARFDVSAVGMGRSPDPLIVAGDVVMVDQSGARTALRDITQGLPILSLFMPLLLL